MAPQRLIKKYANRRLYDATASRHVTLDDLRKLIIDGAQIKVIDDKTGDDITRSVLLQIVAEQEHFGKPILSAQLLHSIVRFYGSAMEELTGQYLERSVDNLLKQQEAVQEHIEKIVSTTPLVNFADLARANVELWTELQERLLASMNPEKGLSNKK